VAFKLAQALAAPTADEDLELVALATVADLMPLRGENRGLVREGLRGLANTVKPGLRALMAVSRTDPSALDAHALGFRLAPRINAAGRMRRPDAGLELLLTDDQERAIEIAAELDAVNAERRAVEERTTWEVERLIGENGPRSAYVLAGEGWHPGVIGIVASRVVERYHRPAIVIALNGESHGQGSGRSIPGFDLLGALHAASEELERYGGHRVAAGLTVARDRVPALAAAIERYAEEALEPELLQPVERVDAVVSGTELGLGLADELCALEPCGMGNPGPSLLVPGGRFDGRRALGDGSHASFIVTSGGTRARAVAFRCGGRVPGDGGEPLDATFRLERNEWRGTVEPRLVLRHAQPCAPVAIEVLGEPEDYLRAALAELDAPLEPERCPSGSTPWDDRAKVHHQREILDRRGESPLAVLADAVATAEPVVAICADVPRRIAGLQSRIGGFALTSYGALEHDPALTGLFRHVVALDPPSSAAADQSIRAGSGFTHLAWGEAELRFALQIYELEYGLRASLAALYRDLKRHGRAAGEELEQLLRGDGRHGRPARLAGRLTRVLAELELVSLDRDLPALEVASDAPTALDRSPAYRAYARRYEDGRRFLSDGKLQRRSG
jgi:single-stranded-DNA-specific exonuclease